jgi:hypothetical protein
MMLVVVVALRLDPGNGAQNVFMALAAGMDIKIACH